MTQILRLRIRLNRHKPTMVKLASQLHISIIFPSFQMEGSKRLKHVYCYSQPRQSITSIFFLVIDAVQNHENMFISM